MTKAKRYAIRTYIVMRKHHERLLSEAIKRNDTSAIMQETAILSTFKARI